MRPAAILGLQLKSGDSMTTSVVATTRVSAPARGGLRYIPTVAFGTDLVLITFSVFAAILGRETLRFPDPLTGVEVGRTLDVAGPAMIIGWVATIAMLGGYRKQVFGAGLDEYKRVINASLVTAAAVGISCYLLRFPLSRGFFVIAFLIGIPVLVLGRHLLRRSVHRARRLGILQHRVVIAGAEGHVSEIASVLGREKWLGYHVIGALTPDPGGRSTTHSGIPLLGSSRSIAEVAIEAEADVVFLAGGAFDSATEMRRLAWDLENEDIAVVIAPSVTDVSSERVSVRPVGGLPLIHLEKPRSQEAVRRAKRTFDVVGSLTLLLLFAPVFVFAALRVRAYDHGPILFRQPRVGRDGAVFSCWKFRTMVTDAEALLADLQAQQGYDGGLFKMEDDPRVTPPGRWLRRFSIDELPQLVNVLKGDMSLVGPRPPLQHEVAQYDDAMARRLRVRPGMTGLWQVSGRSDLAWSEAIRLDLYYVDNWSMVQDLTILARTFGAVFGSRGAY
jgi:exopolysaccharide biosynthesis polyprenyl glycosylphosphotransferase